MSVLDLCELDKNGLVSNNLRRLWIRNRGHDPVRCARLSGQRWWVIVVSVWVVSLSVVVLHLAALTNNGWLLFFGMMSGMVFWAWGLVDSINCFTAGKRAAKFSTLLEQAASWWATSIQDSALWSMNELERKAEAVLRHEAGLLQEYAKGDQPREVLETQRDQFKEAHRVFRELGLAEKTWNPYFEKEEKEEKPAPAEPTPT